MCVRTIPPDGATVSTTSATVTTAGSDDPEETTAGVATTAGGGGGGSRFCQVGLPHSVTGSLGIPELVFEDEIIQGTFQSKFICSTRDSSTCGSWTITNKNPTGPSTPLVEVMDDVNMMSITLTCGADNMYSWEGTLPGATESTVV
ncbi:hypothetical protein CRE_18150 [Caenorhabditis remanei]|uniref:Uncharacterized protein n=1 Tax=Caenorhabditis remanei TaxID=31234 RepID=E3N8M3_CAERE|nr:hypothetical protein CRE_18150 [Caenorhabditis remanei]